MNTQQFFSKEAYDICCKDRDFLLTKLDENEVLKVHVAALKDALAESLLQIEYLHDKFAETGSGNTTILRGKALLESEV